MNDDYVAGLLETLGGFYVFNNKQRNELQPRFKLVGSSEEKLDMLQDMVTYLKTEHNIEFRIYNEGPKNIAFVLSRYDDLERFVIFLEKNCRLQKNHQDWVKKLILRRKEFMKKQEEQRERELERRKELRP